MVPTYGGIMRSKLDYNFLLTDVAWTEYANSGIRHNTTKQDHNTTVRIRVTVLPERVEEKT